MPESTHSLIDPDLSLAGPAKEMGEHVPDAIDWVTIAEASAISGVSARQLRARITAGTLHARKRGKAYQIRRGEIETGARPRRIGRPLSPAKAWNLIAVAARRETPLLSDRERRKIADALRARPFASIATSIGKRAESVRYTADGAEIVAIATDPEILISPVVGLPDGKIRGYVRADRLEEIAARHALEPSSVGTIILRAYADPFPFAGEEGLPELVGIVDAIDDPDPTVVAAGAAAAAALGTIDPDVVPEPEPEPEPLPDPTELAAAEAAAAAAVRRARLRGIAAVAAVAAGTAAAAIVVAIIAALLLRPSDSVEALPLFRPDAPAPIAEAAPAANVPVASRIRIETLGIDLPVINGDTERAGNPEGYPFCDVAHYLTTYGQPDDVGTTYIYAHAQRGMFGPLIAASIEGDDALLGLEIEVFTADGRIHRYELTEIKRGARDFSMADVAATIGEQRLVLQTSEGPTAASTKLQVAARLIETIEGPSDEARPTAYPRICG